MLSAAQVSSPAATLWFLSSKIRAKKYRVVQFLDVVDEERNKIPDLAAPTARDRRLQNRKKVEEIRKEISKRASKKRQKKEEKDRRKIEQSLKTVQLKNLKKSYPKMELQSLEDLHCVLSGNAVGRKLCHTWYDSEALDQVVHNGKIEKKKRRNDKLYVVAYWRHTETYDDAVDLVFRVPAWCGSCLWRSYAVLDIFFRYILHSKHSTLEDLHFKNQFHCFYYFYN